MTCPKCTGLLTLEELQEHSGHFQGWRCIQCGLRLDQRIAQNARTATVTVKAEARSRAAVGHKPRARSR
jgi:transposase-like protein